ncbi:MAG: DUF4058 family protein [Cyanobacteria bacterium P01_A01_bin.135]
MPSPFPGMNPYLEHPDRWSTVHNRLIVALADTLTPQLLPKYQVDIEKRVYEVLGSNSLFVGRPDVTVQRPRTSSPDTASAAGVSNLAAKPAKVMVPMPEEVREAYLEVKETATQAVVTAIEILSPTNKRGDGRRKYEQKRQQVLSSRTNLVEIDLLRESAPLPTLGDGPQSRYQVLVSRASSRPMADLYAFNLNEPIPPFALPLQHEDEEPVVVLQELLEGVYERSGYDYFIDYKDDPLPPLSDGERAWVDAVLQDKGLRGS